MKIAIEGCAHGELEKIYDTIAEIEKREAYKVDLLLCCGDFQSTRNLDDLNCMAVPKKFHDMCSFYKYYSGEKLAPILTIFIGGNHEASNYLQELPYGGWVAPNIYYLGYAGVVQVNGVRIGGLSGIYKGFDYYKGHYELSPYDESTKRSVYHIRQLDVFRLKQLSSKIDIMMSHDWPKGVYNYGNADQLCRFKPHFRDEIDQNKLGSPPCEGLLQQLRPDYWFSAHLHCKFAALIPHENPTGCTKFLALDKCLPKRRFLQVLDFPDAADASEGVTLAYDLEWLAILRITKHLIDITSTTQYMPGPGSPYRYNFTPTDEERTLTLSKMNDNLEVPLNFSRTAEPYNPQQQTNLPNSTQPKAQLNPQTTQLCEQLDIDDPASLVMVTKGLQLNHSTYRDKPVELDDSNNTSFNQSTSDSSFNRSTDCVTEIRKRGIFQLPAPLNDSKDNPEQLSLDDIDQTDDEVPIAEDDDLVAEITEIEPCSINSTISTSFTHFGPDGLIDESTVEQQQHNSSLSDVASLLSTAAKIRSPSNVSKVDDSHANNIVHNSTLDYPNGDGVQLGNDIQSENTKTNTTQGGEIVAPKRFKRRNQEIYATQDDD